MSIQDAVDAAKAVWFDPSEQVLAIAIAGCESGWVNDAHGDHIDTLANIRAAELGIDPDAPFRDTQTFRQYTWEQLGPYACDGYTSIGLWQIHMPAHRITLLGLTGVSDPCVWRDYLIDPLHNAQRAWTIQRQQGWTAWTCYNNEGYKAFLEQAQDAIAGVFGLPVPAYVFPNPFDPALFDALAKVEPHPPGFLFPA